MDDLLSLGGIALPENRANAVPEGGRVDGF
jgi:hypothetical protein